MPCKACQKKDREISELKETYDVLSRNMDGVCRTRDNAQAEAETLRSVIASIVQKLIEDKTER